MLESLDYQAVGLIAGLEVHQQLLTEHKLFCRCPAGLYTETHDGEVLRHMRPTLSELGEYDGTALMEFKTKKEIIYLLNHLNVCTYEMDDTPPFLVNQEAHRRGHRNLPVDEHGHHRRGPHRPETVSRRQHSHRLPAHGHRRRQRLAALQGPAISRSPTSRVEEDSCREVKDKGHRIVWRTDRLGMPLTETVTGPELRHARGSPRRDPALRPGGAEHAAGCAPASAPAARTSTSACAAASGCEIKGVPRAGYAVKLVHNEGLRQVNLLKIPRGTAPPRDAHAGRRSA